MAIPKIIIFFICQALPILALAYEPKDGNVTAALGHFLYTTHFTEAGGPPSPSMQSGLALVANGDLSSKGALELGIFQMSKRFYREKHGYFIGQKTELIHITMGYRWWITRYFSTSLSLFSSYSMGTPNTFYNNFPAGQETDTSAQDITEYGFDGTVQHELWSQGRYSVFAEGRYSWSATAKTREAANHYGLFMAVRYFIQSKEKIKEAP